LTLIPKEFLRNAALVLVSTFLAVLLCEFSYRAYLVLSHEKKAPNPDSKITFFSASRDIYDDRHGYAYNPNTQVRMLSIANGSATSCSAVFDINAFGTFEKDVSDYKNAQLGPNKDRARILVLGDSFTSMQHNGETWVSLFSRQLREKTGTSVEALNFARDGYGVGQMVELAAAEIDRWNPDAVIFAFISDDLRRVRFWRKSTESNGRGYTYVVNDPLDDETSVDSKIVHFFDNRISSEWCDKVTKNEGQDPLIPELANYYRSVSNAELDKNGPRWFSLESYLVNRIVSGTPVIRNSKRPINALHWLKDPALRNAMAKLNKSGIPYYFVHLPTIAEMEKGGRWTLPVDSKKFIEELQLMAGKKPVLFLGDHMKLSKDQLALFPWTPTNGHPSKDGIRYIADAMVDMYLRKDKFATGQGLGTTDEIQALLNTQINKSPLLDSSEGWSEGFAIARQHGGSGVVVGPGDRNLFAQHFVAKGGEQFRIVARASSPRSIWQSIGFGGKKSMGRFQINWTGSGQFIDSYIEPFEVSTEEQVFETQVVAPKGAEAGTLYVVASGPESVVRYTEMRLLGSFGRGK
jgi:hypothetical protein